MLSLLSACERIDALPTTTVAAAVGLLLVALAVTESVYRGGSR